MSIEPKTSKQEMYKSCDESISETIATLNINISETVSAINLVYHEICENITLIFKTEGEEWRCRNAYLSTKYRNVADATVEELSNAWAKKRDELDNLKEKQNNLCEKHRKLNEELKDMHKVRFETHVRRWYARRSHTRR